MEHIRILLLGVSFRVCISFNSPGPMEHLPILLLGVSFRVYISYKFPRPHGTSTHTSIRGFIWGLHKL